MKFLRTLALLGFAAALAIAPAAYAQNTQPAPAKKDAKAAKIDINTATAEQLQTLDGIGEARAAAIIKGRPYSRNDQIVSKAGVPQAVYDAIKDKIVAKQSGGKDKADKAGKKDKKDSGKKDKSKPAE